MVRRDENIVGSGHVEVEHDGIMYRVGYEVLGGRIGCVRLHGVVYRRQADGTWHLVEALRTGQNAHLGGVPAEVLARYLLEELLAPRSTGDAGKT